MRLTVDLSALNEAVRRMGAADLAVDFQLDRTHTALDPIDIELGRGIEVDLPEVDSSHGLLNYKGRQVLLYIADHGAYVSRALENGAQGNKYHVAFCAKLAEMKAGGRYERYVATNKLDGEFQISGKDWQTGAQREGFARLKICKLCLQKLNYQGYRQGNRPRIFSEFSLEEFFATYSSFFPHMPARTTADLEQAHTGDWPVVSGRYKAERAYRCESCGVDLSDHRALLQVRHRNGNTSDNREANLQALCLDCLRKLRGTNKQFVSHGDMRTISLLRRTGGVTGGSDWQEAFELADPGVHAVLHSCRAKHWPPPEVGYELQRRDGAIAAQLELAWPRRRVGVAVSDEDLEAARAFGWQVYSMPDALEQLK
jgi:hypothetical protein